MKGEIEIVVALFGLSKTSYGGSHVVKALILYFVHSLDSLNECNGLRRIQSSICFWFQVLLRPNNEWLKSCTSVLAIELDIIINVYTIVIIDETSLKHLIQSCTLVYYLFLLFFWGVLSERNIKYIYIVNRMSIKVTMMMWLLVKVCLVGCAFS